MRRLEHGDNFTFVGPRDRPAADDAGDEGLVPDTGTRCLGEWSKLRQGNIVAQLLRCLAPLLGYQAFVGATRVQRLCL